MNEARLSGEEGRRFRGNAAGNLAQAKCLNIMGSVPVNSNAARARTGNADAPIGFAFQPLQCTLVVLEIWFEPFKALLVMILSPRRLSQRMKQGPQSPHLL